MPSLSPPQCSSQVSQSPVQSSPPFLSSQPSPPALCPYKKRTFVPCWGALYPFWGVLVTCSCRGSLFHCPIPLCVLGQSMDFPLKVRIHTLSKTIHGLSNSITLMSNGNISWQVQQHIAIATMLSTLICVRYHESLHSHSVHEFLAASHTDSCDKSNVCTI